MYDRGNLGERLFASLPSARTRIITRMKHQMYVWPRRIQWSSLRGATPTAKSAKSRAQPYREQHLKQRFMRIHVELTSPCALHDAARGTSRAKGRRVFLMAGAGNPRKSQGGSLTLDHHVQEHWHPFLASLFGEGEPLPEDPLESEGADDRDSPGQRIEQTSNGSETHRLDMASSANAEVDSAQRETRDSPHEIQRCRSLPLARPPSAVSLATTLTSQDLPPGSSNNAGPAQLSVAISAHELETVSESVPVSHGCGASESELLDLANKRVLTDTAYLSSELQSHAIYPGTLQSENIQSPSSAPYHENLASFIEHGLTPHSFSRQHAPIPLTRLNHNLEAVEATTTDAVPHTKHTGMTIPLFTGSQRLDISSSTTNCHAKGLLQPPIGGISLESNTPHERTDARPDPTTIDTHAEDCLANFSSSHINKASCGRELKRRPPESSSTDTGGRGIWGRGRAKKPRNKARKWSASEQARFEHALEMWGRDWEACARHVGTRDISLIRSHAQKHFIKLFKTGQPLPRRVAESGTGYTLSGNPLRADGPSARSYLTGLAPPHEAAPSQAPIQTSVTCSDRVLSTASRQLSPAVLIAAAQSALPLENVHKPLSDSCMPVQSRASQQTLIEAKAMTQLQASEADTHGRIASCSSPLEACKGKPNSPTSVSQGQHNAESFVKPASPADIAGFGLSPDPVDDLWPEIDLTLFGIPP